MKRTKIHKYFSHEIKDMSESDRTVAFYYNAFGEYDHDKDRIFAGAGKKTKQENQNRIKHLYNHWDTVGKIIEIGEDQKGDFAVSKLGRDTQSNDVYLKYLDGLITEHSFGFDIVKDERNEKGGRDIQEYSLWEVSSLDKWGAQSNTPVISVKSMDKNNIQLWIDRLVKLNKALKGGYTDETILQFESQIMQITEYLKSLATTQPETIDETTEPEPITKGIDLNKLITLF